MRNTAVAIFLENTVCPQRTLADTHVTVREDRKQQKCYRVKDKLFMDEAWARGEGQDMDVWKSSAGNQI